MSGNMVYGTTKRFLKNDPMLQEQAGSKNKFGKISPLNDNSLMHVRNYRTAKPEIKQNQPFKLPKQYKQQINKVCANILKGIRESVKKERGKADPSIFFPGQEQFENAITEIGGFERGEVSACHVHYGKSKNVGLTLPVPGATRIKKLDYVDPRNNGSYETHNIHIILDYSDLGNLTVTFTKYHSREGRVKDEAVFPLSELTARMQEFATELYSIRRARKTVGLGSGLKKEMTVLNKKISKANTYGARVACIEGIGEFFEHAFAKRRADSVLRIDTPKKFEVGVGDHDVRVKVSASDSLFFQLELEGKLVYGADLRNWMLPNQLKHLALDIINYVPGMDARETFTLKNGHKLQF
ncbi:MAG: hypothetical protein WCT52_05975 [Candidatus Micrarchaeia archaeon]